MQIRTDLALEARENINEIPEGVTSEEEDSQKAHISRITVKNSIGAQNLGKPVGKYITIEIPPISDDNDMDEDIVRCIKNEVSALLPKDGTVLAVGLGNTEITPDALGPKAASAILATRHITGEIARSVGLEKLRGVAVLAPGVLGQTGIESSEIIEGIVEKTRPSAVIVIDALASRRLNRLGCTIQLSDSGISPGSGVGNHRREISRATVGAPVISVGVPTVVDAATLAYDLLGHESSRAEKKCRPRGADMIVTPREIDLIIDRAARLIGHSLNCALQPDYDSEILLSLTR